MAYGHLVHYLQKSSDDFNFGQKKCPKIKPSEILGVRNFYSTIQNFEFTPKLSFMLGFMEQTIVETLLEIRNGLIKFALFCRRCIRKTQYCTAQPCCA